MYMYINKLGSRSYGYIHPKSSHICVIHLVLERCCFETVLPKKGLGPLGIKYLFVVARGSQRFSCSVKKKLKQHKSDLCIVPKRFHEVVT